MIVLDTNVVSELMKPAPDAAVAAWLVARPDISLVTTAITVSEIMFGLHRLPEGRRKASLVDRFETLVDEGLLVLPLDDASAREAGRHRAMRQAQGLPSQALDMLIAGITLVAGAALATRNDKDFSDLPLNILNPWRSPGA
ncbi:MAG: type II toxin-antitoxin system VapC family toxin [Alphaproteobacteria bacterium]|nr:type II toxin-antitoxin system VapC family toxin [Alphaproteobacteria bacterium]